MAVCQWTASCIYIELYAHISKENIIDCVLISVSQFVDF